MVCHLQHQVLVEGILNNIIIERRSWLIYAGVKGFLILVSLVLFSCVSRRYRYRQRDEIVNVQGMTEDTHERWLDQEELGDGQKTKWRLQYVQTPLVHLVANCAHPKTVRSALLRCPNTTVALRLLVNVVRVTNLEAVKIEFRHLPFLILLLQTA